MVTLRITDVLCTCGHTVGQHDVGILDEGRIGPCLHCGCPELDEAAGQRTV